MARTILGVGSENSLRIFSNRSQEMRILNEDGFGKIDLEGDHKVHVINVTHDTLTLDTRFELDFDTAFPHPARPRGPAMK